MYGRAMSNWHVSQTTPLDPCACAMRAQGGNRRRTGFAMPASPRNVGAMSTWVIGCFTVLPLGMPGPAAACGVLNKQCEATVRTAVAALQCEGGSGSRSGARAVRARYYCMQNLCLTRRQCETGRKLDEAGDAGRLARRGRLALAVRALVCAGRGRGGALSARRAESGEEEQGVRVWNPTLLCF